MVLNSIFMDTEIEIDGTLLWFICSQTSPKSVLLALCQYCIILYLNFIYF